MFTPSTHHCCAVNSKQSPALPNKNKDQRSEEGTRDLTGDRKVRGDA